MKGSRALTFVLALALVFSLAACDDNGSSVEEQEPELLSDILENRPELGTLLDAVEASGQSDLFDQGNITVLAPNDDAFTDINTDAALADENSELLGAILQHHVVPQSVLSSELSEGTISTSAGDDVQITRDDQGNFLVNGNLITDADLEAEDGVVHIIDGLLLENRSLAERLLLTTPTSQLAQLAEDIGATGTIGDLENGTLFAPRNIQDDVEEAEADLNEDQLTSALLYHVVNAEALVEAGVLEEAGPVDSETLIGLLEGAEGNVVEVPTLLEDEDGRFETITIALNEDGSITINDGQAELDQGTLDKFTDNFSNVFHVIDGVLLPPSLQPAISIAEALETEGSGDPVRVQGTVTRVFGSTTVIQDETAGIVVSRRDDVADAATEGDVLEVFGSVSTFNGLFQLDQDNVNEFEVVSSGNDLPEPAEISLDEVGDFQSQLVRIDGLEIADDKGDDVFQGGGAEGNYDVTDGDVTITLRIDSNSFYVGEPIPEGTFTFEGITGEFNGEQIFPLNDGDIIEE